MTRWWDTNQQVDRSLSIKPILAVSCSAMDTSSALNICEHLNITLYMPLIYAPLYFLCIWGCKSNETNNPHHTSCIHKGLHAEKWPDLMTSKPDSVTTMGQHWTDHTGRPLESEVHWDATGTSLTDASTQWCPSGDPVLICIIWTHWNTTGRPLEDHWQHIGNTLATNNSFSSGISMYTGV